MFPLQLTDMVRNFLGKSGSISGGWSAIANYFWNIALLKFSLTRFLIALTCTAVLIGYCSRYGSAATISASISAMGLFVFVLIFRIEHFAFLLTVMPLMVIGYLPYFSLANMGNKSRLPAEAIIYGPLTGAIIGAVFGFYLLNLVSQQNEKCSEEFTKEQEGVLNEGAGKEFWPSSDDDPDPQSTLNARLEKT